MARRGEPFLSPDQLQKRAKRWKDNANRFESDPWNKWDAGLTYKYRTGRVERRDAPDADGPMIDEIHGVSFIEQVIPDMLERRRSHGDATPVKILDIGGGDGSYTHSLREHFGHDVEVYSTGLRKGTAQFNRALREYGRLHPNDLKWRSILQLSRSPEFDLIIDTIAEFTYGVNSKEELRQYLEAVMAKLNPGGIASIANDVEMRDPIIGLQEVLEDLSKNPNYSFHLDKTLRIGRLA